MTRAERGGYRPPTGAGLWGPARGNPGAWTKDNHPSGEAKRRGIVDAKEYKAQLSERRQKMLNVLDRALENAEDSKDPQAVSVGLRAVQHIEERLDGKVTQPIGGPDGGPIPTSLTLNFVKPGGGRQSGD